MRISNLRIDNYKSFRESTDIEFDSGFNVVIGKNNAGKTALLEALSLGFDNHPHVSTKTKPTATSTIAAPNSRAQVTFSFKPDQLENIANDVREILHFAVARPTQFTSNEQRRTTMTQLLRGFPTHVWPVDSDTEREDLSLPLTECGTGVGQILSILYVAVTSDSPKVIIVDEPQSFLHPGALRKLIDILRYEQTHEHQYIFSSHSPQIIASSAPTAFHLVTKVEMESYVQRMDASDVAHQRELLADLGVTMSDVLSAENIIWVEGQTEEQAFPLILSSFGGSEPHRSNRLLGTAILAVVATGDLDGKHKERVAGIYRRLSTGSALIPPTLAFILDPEYRSDSEKSEIARKLGVEVRWLGRTMYENYLLVPGAIVQLIRSFAIEEVKEPDLAMVSQALQNHLLSKIFYKGVVPADADERIRIVDGSKLLDSLVRDLTGPDSGCAYSDAKAEYGMVLTRWILDNEPERLKEVFDLLSDVLQRRSEIKV